MPPISEDARLLRLYNGLSSLALVVSVLSLVIAASLSEMAWVATAFVAAVIGIAARLVARRFDPDRVRG